MAGHRFMIASINFKSTLIFLVWCCSSTCLEVHTARVPLINIGVNVRVWQTHAPIVRSKHLVTSFHRMPSQLTSQTSQSQGHSGKWKARSCVSSAIRFSLGYWLLLIRCPTSFANKWRFMLSRVFLYTALHAAQCKREWEKHTIWSGSYLTSYCMIHVLAFDIENNSIDWEATEALPARPGTYWAATGFWKSYDPKPYALCPRSIENAKLKICKCSRFNLGYYSLWHSLEHKVEHNEAEILYMFIVHLGTVRRGYFLLWSNFWPLIKKYVLGAAWLQFWESHVNIRQDQNI